MDTVIPSNWKYDASKENLLLFYQASKEKLSFYSPDTYRLTVHNSITLCLEANKIYYLLDERNAINSYYTKYIPVIIDELLDSIHNDDILKKLFGMRLDSIITGLSTARNDSSLLLRWINMILRLCDLENYANLCKEQIINIVTGNNKNKSKLLKYINDYYVSLINMGYDEEYLYQTLIHYFDNRSRIIDSVEAVKDFLNTFDYELKRIELYLIADTYHLDSFTKRTPEFKDVMSTTKLDVGKIAELANKSKSVKTFYDNYKFYNTRDNIYMISYVTNAIDPYAALQELEDRFELIQTLNGYYRHKAEQRVYFDVIEKCSETWFRPIHLRKIIPNRPFLKDEIIDEKIKTILRSSSLSHRASISLFSALNKHFDAISCRNQDTMLRDFWVALESLFYETAVSGERENVIHSLLHIIDKTYMLKIMRTVYAQLIDATSGRLGDIGITSFDSFLEYFAEFNQESEEFKRITGLLVHNPLLRSRIYNLRKDFGDSKHIQKKLEKHHNKIEWQIHRIHRARNLSTHIGIAMPYMKEILFNLHNYFDYVVNYIICKLENQEYVDSISSIIFEAKNDNQIYYEYLKKNENLSLENYQHMLFGPDNKMLNYNFEIVAFDTSDAQGEDN